MIYRGPGLSFLHAPSSHLPPASCFSFLVFHVCRPSISLTRNGQEEGGEEPNHTTARKPGPLYIIKYSLRRISQSLVTPG